VQAKDTYWANQVQVQRLGAAAVVAHIQGSDKKAIELARAAADLDGSMDKHPATPAAVYPARELLADLLLETHDATHAMTEYQESLRSEPNRFRSMLGKARAAKQLGDDAEAKTAYQKLVMLGAGGGDRPEMAEARAFLAN
jgi:predicted Zn-dependent protease